MQIRASCAVAAQTGGSDETLAIPIGTSVTSRNAWYPVRSALTTNREASPSARRIEPAANLQVCLSFSDKRFVTVRRD